MMDFSHLANLSPTELDMRNRLENATRIDRNDYGSIANNTTRFTKQTIQASDGSNAYEVFVDKGLFGDTEGDRYIWQDGYWAQVSLLHLSVATDKRAFSSSL